MTNSPIAIILPAREGFSPNAFGAVSLSVRDFIYHSRFADRCVVMGASDAEPYENTNYHQLDVKRHWYEPNTRAYVRAAMQQIEAMQPALIEVHNRPIIARAIAKQTSIPVILHLHNDPQEMKYAKTPGERAALAGDCNAIYCISEWVRNRFIAGLNNDVCDHIHTTHSGIAIAPTPNFAHKKKQIVFVGRMTPNKGGVEFAEALAQVLPKHSDWHGIMIGGRRHEVSANLSDYEKQVTTIMESAGERAHFEGFYPHEKCMQTYAESDIVVIPSLWQEPFGRIGIEATSHGCAVVTSGSGGLSEIVGDSGMVLGETTAKTIANALNYLITHQDQMRDMQQRAYIQSKQFDIQTCTNRIDAIRAQVMGLEEQANAA